MDNTRRRWPFGFKGQFKVMDDPVDRLRIIYKRNDRHFAAAGGTEEGIYLINFADHLGPAFGWHLVRVIFHDERIRRISHSFAHLASVGIGIKAVAADHELTLVRNMGSDSGDELQMVVKLMTKKIIANYYEGKAPVPKEARYDLKFIWNDEFQILFDSGVVKIAEKWDKNDRQKYTIPKPKKINYLVKNNRLTFYFQ